MKKICLFLFSLVLLGFMQLSAQDIVTSSPSPLQEDSEDVVITFHADLGNKGLMGLTESTPIYAHTGVITNLSDGQWAYAPQWLDNIDKYKLTYVSENTWQLHIGDIRTYYGITNPDEFVKQLAFVFRNATGSREGKTATGEDIFIDVLPAGYQLEFTSTAPFVLNASNATVTFTARATQNSDIQIYFDDVNSTPIASVENAMELTTTYTFSQGDSYDVIAKATSGSETATQTIIICYPGNSKEAPYPGGGTPQMGAVAQDNNDVTFCIAAPGKTNAILIGSWNDYRAKGDHVMNYTDVDGIRYFWTTVSGLDPDIEYPYYYLINSTLYVGDPYARLVLDPYNDKWLADGTYPGLIPYPMNKINKNVMLAVYKGNRDVYDWKVKDFRGVDQSDLIIYELLIRDFTGTEGQAKGNGTIRQAMEKLDYLQDLGINAIELMPIQEFNGNNSWGYNTNFYMAPDKAYGSPDDYRAFIDECHSRGIAVILDVVFNQSDGMHPWYQMYSSASNPFYNASAPHAYSVLNDWNQDNLLVQQQWTDMITYWMTAYKVDGFRFDLVKGLGDNESYGGNASEYNTNKYNASRVARMKRLTEVMHAINPYSYSINENLAGAQEENQMAENGQLNWANINNAACQFAMGYSSDSNCNRFYAPNDSRNWGSTVSYAESHDEQRVAYKQDMWGVAGVKGNLETSMQRLGSVAAQMILAPGAHMIWQFGELGNGTNTKNSDGGNNTDPKPVYWNYFNDPDRHGLYDSYRELISIRNLNPELFAQGESFSMSCSTANWNNGRFIYASAGSKELICVINPTVGVATFNANFKSTDNANYVIASQSYGAEATFDASAGTVTLPGGCYAVITTSDVSGIGDVKADSAFGSAASVIGGVGEVIIRGDYTDCSIYTISGQKVANHGLLPGIYIVTVDSNPYKVIVK